VLVGSGGFAAVYRAHQPAFQRTVAVKVLSAPHADQRSRDRFERECRAMGSLSEHPNIVTLHDAGFTADGHAYLVMAYLSGGSLAGRLHDAGPLGWEDAVVHGGEVADALAAAHRKGVLHRDVKPDNVLLSRYGTAFLGDFGIARMADDSASQGITATLAYAAPEVLLGAEPSPASDVYSLGATLHELVVGSPPHPKREDEHVAAYIRRLVDEPAPALHRAYAPEPLAELITTMLAGDPSDRPASAAAVRASLRSLSRAHGLEDDDRPRAQERPPAPDHEATVALGAVPPDERTTPAPPTPPGAPPATTVAFLPSHRVALSGASAWERPDAALAPVAVLDPWLDVTLLGWHGAWAQVRCANGWVCWVDGGLLEPYR
jgi:serine/threonine protein kinase